LLAKNFGLPESAFDGFPKEEVYFARGSIPPETPATPLQGWKTPPLTHKYELLKQQPHRMYKGGREWGVESTPLPASTTRQSVSLVRGVADLENRHGCHP